MLLTLFLSAGWNAPLLISLLKPRLLGIEAAGQYITHEVNRGNQFVYPKLGISAPVEVTPGTMPIYAESWDQLKQSLNKGTNLSFPEPVWPEAKLAFLTGHSSDTYPHAYSAIFAGLGQAKTGDRFYLTLDGQSYTYRVVDKKIINPSDWQSFLKVKPEQAQEPYLALVTCWPPLTTKQRLVVVGKQL